MPSLRAPSEPAPKFEITLPCTGQPKARLVGGGKAWVSTATRGAALGAAGDAASARGWTLAGGACAVTTGPRWSLTSQSKNVSGVWVQAIRAGAATSSKQKRRRGMEWPHLSRSGIIAAKGKQGFNLLGGS